MTSPPLPASGPRRAPETQPGIARKVKPSLRGVSHEFACYASVLAGAYLIHRARAATAPELGQAPVAGAVIYSICLFALFAVSALYHRPDWAPGARARMRRFDHSTIYLMIAGSATPIGLIALDGSVKATFLLVLWIGAALGVVKSLLWAHAPKPLSALAYVLLGLSTVPFMGRIGGAIGPGPTRLILAGGALYVLGAVVYALKRPDPLPEAFGYHEIFHALVIAAAACQYLAILRLVNALA